MPLLFCQDSPLDALTTPASGACDASDGLTPKSAWKHLAKLWTLQPGDTAYVRPGLYREWIDLQNDGTPDARITLIADGAGKSRGLKA